MKKENNGLTISRKNGEGFYLLQDGEPVARVSVISTHRSRIKIKIQADESLDILRDELLD